MLDRQAYEKKLNYCCKEALSADWTEVAPIPPKIMMELTNACNHRCLFCANRRMKRPVGFMEGGVFRRVATEAVGLGVREIALYTTGESLLHPELPELVAFARQAGFSYVYLSSNGALLTPELSRRLIEAGLHSLRISFNAGSRESYHKLHGRDDFDTVVENIRHYDRIRKELEAETLLSVGCVLNRWNSGEKSRLERLLSGHVDAFKWTRVRVQGGQMPQAIKEMAAEERGRANGIEPCGLLWNGLHVTYSGRLSLCCVDFDEQMVVGDVLREGLAACWNGEQMRGHRRLHLSRALDPEGPCYKCLTG